MHPSHEAHARALSRARARAPSGLPGRESATRTRQRAASAMVWHAGTQFDHPALVHIVWAARSTASLGRLRGTERHTCVAARQLQRRHAHIFHFLFGRVRHAPFPILTGSPPRKGALLSQPKFSKGTSTSPSLWSKITTQKERKRYIPHLFGRFHEILFKFAETLV